MADTGELLIRDDIARCAGRLGLDLDAPICLRREKCARYLQMFMDCKRHSDAFPMRLSYYTGLCRDGSDHMIPVDHTATAGIDREDAQP